jgi:hypothetical protein
MTFTGSFAMAFDNEHVVYEQMIKCLVKDYEFNYSYNKTLIQSGSEGNLKNFATSSDFQPYVTAVGLYNDANELLAVAKMGQPVPMSRTTDTVFLIRFDR